MECLYCGRFIEIRSSRDEKRNFCSRICCVTFWNFSQAKPYETRSCLQCKSTFSVKCSKKKYCSLSCGRYKPRPERLGHKKFYYSNCKTCNSQIVIHNIAQVARGEGQYCSNECSRKYSVNKNYFSNIETEKQAYWLGFIFADGCNTGKELRINLSNRDASHLQKLKEELEYNGPMSVNVERNIISLRVACKTLIEDLDRNGCVRAKSLIVKFPVLLPHLVRHFIRGVFDGDGCISSYSRESAKNKELQVWKASIFSGSSEFIESIYDILRQEKINPTTWSLKNGRGFNVGISNRKGLLAFYEYLYKDCNVFLERKYQKFKKFLEYDKHHPVKDKNYFLS